MISIKLIYRFVLIIGAVLAFLLGLIFFLWLSDLSLAVFDRLSQQPTWFVLIYIGLFILCLAISIYLLWRFLPKPKSTTFTKTNSPSSVDEKKPSINVEILQDKLDVLSHKEVDTEVIQKELDKLKSSNNSKDIVITLFGDISSGKSSLIKAILPRSEGDVSVLGGTTQDIIQYEWQSPLGEKLIIIDTPGFDDISQELEQSTKEAVYKSHVAIYLCEGDLTASQYQQLEEISLLEKPIIVALNKTDRYSDNDLNLIKVQLKQKLTQLSKQSNLVLIQTGGSREVTLVYPDGTEKKSLRKLDANLSELLKMIESVLSAQSLSALESLRQKTVLNFLNTQLVATEKEHLKKRSDTVIQESTKKAVVAAMASITPGTDILIQGYLGVQMVKELCEINGVSAATVDIEKLLSLLQKNTIGFMPILLGIAGNGFKAFPGVGTVTGGILHAVTYGLIFDSIGRSVSLCLSTHGKLSPALIDSLYKEKLLDKIEIRSFELVKTLVSKKITKH